MAVEIKLGVTSDLDKFTFNDNAGVYDLTLNPIGYGVPNLELANVVSAEVEITFPDGSIETVDVFPTLPDDDDTILFDVLPSLIGKTEFPAGVYSIKYTLVDNVADEYIDEVKYFHQAPIACCIGKRFAALKSTSDSSQKIEVLLQESLLKGAIWNASLGRIDCVEEVAGYLASKCSCCS
jgi:hypothetical protein